MKRIDHHSKLQEELLENAEEQLKLLKAIEMI